MNLVHKFLSAILLIATLSACGESYFYQKTSSLLDKEWSYNDELVFDFTITDSIQPYDLYLDLKSSKDYAYENVYIDIETHFPSDTIIKDQLSLELNNKDGSYTGDCSGNMCTTRFILQKNARFRFLGGYKISLRQSTRLSLLEGIESVGFYIQESKELEKKE